MARQRGTEEAQEKTFRNACTVFIVSFSVIMSSDWKLIYRYLSRDPSGLSGVIHVPRVQFQLTKDSLGESVFSIDGRAAEPASRTCVAGNGNSW